VSREMPGELDTEFLFSLQMDDTVELDFKGSQEIFRVYAKGQIWLTGVNKCPLRYSMPYPESGYRGEQSPSYCCSGGPFGYDTCLRAQSPNASATGQVIDKLRFFVQRIMFCSQQNPIQTIREA
jgi:hypothetical protein